MLSNFVGRYGPNSDVVIAPGVVVGALPRTGAPVRWVQVLSRPVTAADGAIEMLTVLADVTGTREARDALALSEAQFRLAMENAPIGMALVDAQWRLQEVNAAMARLLGGVPQALVGRDLSALSHPEDRAAERAQVHRLLAGEAERFTLEKRYVRPDGQTVWAVLDVVLVRVADGAPDHFVVQIRDVTDQRMQSEMLAHRAVHDPLTGLANRALMQEVLQRAVEPPDAPGRVAVIAVDLDEFKQVNDRFGHAAGDDVLVHVAGVLRAATAGRGTVARIGGDDFQHALVFDQGQVIVVDGYGDTVLVMQRAAHFVRLRAKCGARQQRTHRQPQPAMPYAQLHRPESQACAPASAGR